MSLLTHIKSGAARLTQLSLGAALGVGLLASALPDVAWSQEAAQAAVPVAATRGPALWVVRDADSTVYLFGTVHLLRPGGDWMTPTVSEAFDSADELWLEIEDPTDQAAAAPLIMQHGLSPQVPLSSLLTAEEFARVDEAARALGLTGETMDPMRPWLAGITLAMAPLVQAGFDPQAGVDVVLRGHALEAGKPIHGLETMEQQLMFFANMSRDDELAFLRSTLEDYENSATMLDQMSAAWAAGDPDALYDLGGAEMKTEYPSIYDLILTRRNADWAGQIQTELDGSGTVFIAVGALHLAGPDSVQAQLAARGITAARIE